MNQTDTLTRSSSVEMDYFSRRFNLLHYSRYEACVNHVTHTKAETLYFYDQSSRFVEVPPNRMYYRRVSVLCVEIDGVLIDEIPVTKLITRDDILNKCLLEYAS